MATIGCKPEQEWHMSGAYRIHLCKRGWRNEHYWRKTRHCCEEEKWVPSAFVGLRIQERNLLALFTIK